MAQVRNWQEPLRDVKGPARRPSFFGEGGWINIESSEGMAARNEHTGAMTGVWTDEREVYMEIRLIEEDYPDQYEPLYPPGKGPKSRQNPDW